MKGKSNWYDRVGDVRNDGKDDDFCGETVGMPEIESERPVSSDGPPAEGEASLLHDEIQAQLRGRREVSA